MSYRQFLELFGFWAIILLLLLGYDHAIQPSGNNLSVIAQEYVIGSAGGRSPEEEGFWAKLATDPVAFFTAVLAGFTLVLGASTVLLWNETRRSVDAVVAADLPRLRLSTLAFGRAGDAEPRDNSKYALVTIGFTNYGGKSALVTEVCFDQLFSQDLPNAPKYDRIVRYPSYPIVILPGEEHVFPDQLVDDTGNEQLAKVLKEPSALRFWIYGYIAFEDHLGKAHRVGFVGDWNHRGAGIGQMPTPAMQRGETFYIFDIKHYTYAT